jgi:hypothetical protein
MVIHGMIIQTNRDFGEFRVFPNGILGEPMYDFWIFYERNEFFV